MNHTVSYTLVGLLVSHSAYLFLAENQLIPTELRREALALQGSLEFDDAGGEGKLCSAALFHTEPTSVPTSFGYMSSSATLDNFPPDGSVQVSSLCLCSWVPSYLPGWHHRGSPWTNAFSSVYTINTVAFSLYSLFLSGVSAGAEVSFALVPKCIIQKAGKESWTL